MASVYDYEVGSELTSSSRRPARRSLKSLYSQALHWQFFLIIIAINIIAYLLYFNEKGIFSVEFFIYAILLPFAFRFLIYPCFLVLRGYIAPKNRLILSLSFSGVILTFLAFSIFYFGGCDTYSFIKEKVCSVPRFFSSFSMFSTDSSSSDHSLSDSKDSKVAAMVEGSEVEFRLVPYARVFDVSDHKSDPKFLIESHLKSIRFKRLGEFIFRFDYMGNIYTKKIEIKSSGNYILFFDMRQGRFWFRAKGD